MNVGLREAADLAGIVTDILHDGDTPQRLEAYNRERLAEWRFLLGREGGLVPGEQAEPWVARNAGRLLPCLPASGRDLIELARRLGLEAT